MPKAKRKPKKIAEPSSSSDGAEKSINTGVANLSLSPLHDISPLLLSSAAPKDGKLPFKLPYIGPISLVQQHQSVVHGRGLIAARDVSPGECLFVIPAVAAAPIDEVYNRFLGEDEEEDYDDIDDDIGASNNDASFIKKDGPHLESIAEEILIEQIQYLLDVLDDEKSACAKETMSHAKSLLHAFVSQMSSDEVPTTPDLMKILLPSNNAHFDKDKQVIDRETILNIIRRNAFGPDFHNYDAIATCWNTTPDGKKCYNRLLGAYPLSAMINHSCSPNAVRVFGYIPNSDSCDPSKSEFGNKIQGKEVMIVHANKAISKGTEITWSYIPPAIPLIERREALLSKYGFICNCLRCIQEEKALTANPLATQCDYLPGNETSMREMIQAIEQNPSSNEIRVSYAPLYLEYFNAALAQSDTEKINDILKLATRLHFSFVACNNACTEHLSILHMCYELAGVLHTRALQQKKEGMAQVRFWTEQLKKTVMTRYGNLGENVEFVRALMKHSKLVLRMRNGWYSADDKFI
mmetsp:Transcript_299/g.574  ORF Transcript_299/g.574 Transcript_299/m.574 type:complete len:522 (+) Transcript_299:121-1686(+)